MRVNGENLQFDGIEEKPVQRFFVNGGIYVLNPSALRIIVKDEPLDMTTLFQRVVDAGMRTTVFPIREYWLGPPRLFNRGACRARS